MRVQQLIEELEGMDPDMLILSGTWNSSYQEYVNLHLHPLGTIQNNTRVVKKISDTHFRDRDSGGGCDSDNPLVLIL